MTQAGPEKIDAPAAVAAHGGRADGPAPPPGPAGYTLEVRDLHKSYDGTEVLRGVNLAVRAGEVVAVIGPSGGGKSTLLRCINLLETPDSGLILRHGQPFGPWTDEVGQHHPAPRRDVRQGRARMPMVFQSFNLFQHLTALDNVAIGQRVVLGRSKEDARRNARETLTRVGLESKFRAYPATLSGGQQQRVGIARALAMNPDMLLLDEPTSSLDPEMTGEVLAIIRELAADGLTMIIATHEMSLARAIASQVHFIEDGLVGDSGTPAEIFDAPRQERIRAFLRAVVR